MTHLLTVDPGNSSGWALWDRDPGARALTLRRFGLLRLDAVDGVLEATELLGELSPSWLGARVVVEGQWFRCPACHAREHGREAGRGSTLSLFRTVQRLIENRCAWQHAARMAGAEVEVASPGTWIPAVTKGLLGKSPDDRIRQRVRQEWPQLDATADEHPALLLGLWWAQKHRGRCVVEISGKGER